MGQQQSKKTKKGGKDKDKDKDLDPAHEDSLEELNGMIPRGSLSHATGHLAHTQSAAHEYDAVRNSAPTLNIPIPG